MKSKREPVTTFSVFECVLNVALDFALICKFLIVVVVFEQALAGG